MSSSGAVSAKTARACDYCICRRARWYCAADDAFLCQGCDGSVHSANAVARRHERLRLSTASSKPSIIPSWHRGPHRRARTPRHAKHLFNKLLPTTTITTTTTNTTNSQDDENEDSDPLQHLYRVPVLDPFVAELCSSTAGESECTELIVLREDGQDQKCNNNNKASFLPVDLDMDLDMAEFAPDVESLLGKGFDGESYVINEGVGLLDCHGRGQLVKAEEEEEETVPFDLCFDYNSLGSCEEADADEPVVRESQEENCRTNDDEKREWRISLRLDYEAISAAWASQGSPWMNGERPHINPNDCLFLHGTMGLGTIGEQEGVIRDGGREARVLRYRQKRRTRLFSKTIRYEVRKLNAEKRPRMKGRFVKRSSLLTQ